MIIYLAIFAFTIFVLRCAISERRRFNALGRQTRFFNGLPQSRTPYRVCRSFLFRPVSVPTEPTRGARTASLPEQCEPSGEARDGKTTIANNLNWRDGRTLAAGRKLWLRAGKEVSGWSRAARSLSLAGMVIEDDRAEQLGAEGRTYAEIYADRAYQFADAMVKRRAAQ